MHVHDLVDFVSEEAVIAGKSAVKHIKGEREKNTSVAISTDGKIRYTVPQNITEIEDTTVYFRVSDVYRDKKITVKEGERIILEKKKQKLAPGEMESVKLSAKMLSEITSGKIEFSLQ